MIGADGSNPTNLTANFIASTPVDPNSTPTPTPTPLNVVKGTTQVFGYANSVDVVSVAQVSFSVNGEVLYDTYYVVPSGISELTIVATAVDNLGQAFSVTRTVSVLPDPGTTVNGRMLANQQPLANATVTIYSSGGVA